MRMMKRLIQYTLLLVLFAPSLSVNVKLKWKIDDIWTSSAKCGRHHLEFKESCYYFSTVEKTMEFAYKDCLDRKAILFVPNTAEEFKFINSTLGNTHKNWIGLFKKSESSELIWLTPDALDLSNLPLIFGKHFHNWSEAKRCGVIKKFDGYDYPAILFEQCEDLVNEAAAVHRYICERNSSITIV